MSVESETNALDESSGPERLFGSSLSDTGSTAALAARMMASAQTARAVSIDAAWRQAVMRSIRDGLLIFDDAGLVLELNQAFTDLLGYSMEDGPFRPPYPWWPTEQEDPEALAQIRAAYDDIVRGGTVELEYRFYTRDRRPVWVHSTGAAIQHEAIGTTHLRILRDTSRVREARERRAAAARVSQSFATVDDLESLIGIAEHGFGLLFDGDCTIRIGAGDDRLWFSADDAVDPGALSPAVLAGLDAEPSPDAVSLRPGIVLVPPTRDVDCRAWVQFPRPRSISVEEMIAADLLATAFGAAVQQVTTMQRAADREANLQHAVESHRLVGQATGILVERHRLLPGEAFDRLRRASQRRNLKLRDVAMRVIETGLDPEAI